MIFQHRNTNNYASIPKLVEVRFTLIDKSLTPYPKKKKRITIRETITPKENVHSWISTLLTKKHKKELNPITKINRNQNWKGASIPVLAYTLSLKDKGGRMRVPFFCRTLPILLPAVAATVRQIDSHILLLDQ